MAVRPARPRYGHFVNADLAEYRIPVHADIPGSSITLDKVLPA